MHERYFWQGGLHFEQWSEFIRAYVCPRISQHALWATYFGMYTKRNLVHNQTGQVIG